MQVIPSPRSLEKWDVFPESAVTWILRDLSSVFWGFIHLKQVSPSPLKSQKEPQHSPSQKNPKKQKQQQQQQQNHFWLIVFYAHKGLARVFMRQVHTCPTAEISSSHVCRQWGVQKPLDRKSEGLARYNRSATHHRFNHLPALQFTEAPCAWGLASVLHFSYLNFCCSKHFLQWPQTWQKENCFLNSDKVMPPRETWWYCSSLCQNRFWA